MTKRTKKSLSGRTVFVLIVVVVLLIGGGWVFAQNAQKKNESKTTADGTAYSPPTDQEKASGDEQKEEIIKDANTPIDTTSDAAITIVDASYYRNLKGDEGGPFIEVRAYVSNAIDQNASCTITVTGKTTITKTVAANADAKLTWCDTVDMSLSNADFDSNDSWQVSVTYNGASKTGTKKQTIKAVN